MASLRHLQIAAKSLKNIGKTLFEPVLSPHRCHSDLKSLRVDDANTYVVDMRSDCFTQPSDAVRQAMAAGTMGDDVFNEDPTVHELQDKIADMFGMEAALFVPSGTMGNLISVLCHCRLRGQEAVFGHMSHMIMYEQGGVAQLGGVMPRTIPNMPDGTFDLDHLNSYIRPNNDPHQPLTGVITVENTHANCGGRVLPLEFLAKLRQKTQEFGIPFHMDGARVFNAAVSMNVEVKEILQHVDSVSVCLSKCVGAPIGSVIGGSAQLITQSIRLRKVLGGGWRQPGALAAAALVALSDHRERIAQDHKHAMMFAQGVMEDNNDIVHVDLDGVQSNIVMINIKKPDFTAAEFCDRLNMISDEESMDMEGERIRLRCSAFYRYVARVIICHNNSTNDIKLALMKVNYVLKILSQ